MARPLSARRRFVNPLRTMLFWVGFAGVTVLGVILQIAVAVPCVLVPRLRRRRGRRLWNDVTELWARNACRMARWAGGMTLRVDGHPPPGRFIAVANHQSTLDIPVLYELLPGANLKFVAKRELLHGIPFVSWALRYGGHGSVDFDDRAGSLRALVHFARGLEAWDASAVIFPEGRRSFDGSLGPFRESGLKVLVRENRLPIVPIVIDGLWHARSLGEFFLYLPEARCRVSILPPVTADAVRDDGFVARLEETMRAELRRLRGTAEKENVPS